MKKLLYRPKTLERKRIKQVLMEATKLPFTLIVAPMGYGKTSIVQSYLDEVQGEKIWLSLGRNEYDNESIWKRLLEKLKQEGYISVEKIEDIGIPKTQKEIRHFLDGKEHILKEPLYLIMDNCHECQNDEFVPLLEAVVYKKIPYFHIIMISRIYPRIRYEEMWVKGFGVVLEQSFLALTKEEQKEFFQINDIHLKDEENEFIYGYTEGWISAAYLVLLDYKQNESFSNFGGINSLVRNFIFKPLLKEYQYILMCMSLFDEFTVEQVSYITQLEASTYLLPELYEIIGFIKYDSKQKMYSIHGVLQSVVKKELEFSDMDCNKLYNRAGQWYEKEKNYGKALFYYMKAEDKKKCFIMIEQISCVVLYDIAPKLVCKFFDNVTKEDKLSHPKAYFQFLYKRILNENSIEVKHLYEEAREWYDQKIKNENIENSILGELSILEWNIKFNHLDQMIECAKRAYEFLDGKQSYVFNSDIIFTYGIPEVLMLFYNQIGKLKETIQLEKQFATYYMKLINGYDGGWDLLYNAEYYLTTGNFEEADVLAEKVCEKSLYKKQLCVLLSGYYIRLRVAVHQGNQGKFEQYIRDLDKYMKEYQEKTNDIIRPELFMEYDLVISYVNGILGRTENMVSWIRVFDLKQCNSVLRSARIVCISYGIWLIQQKNWSRLDVLAEEMRIPYRNTKHILVDIYAFIFYAISKYHLFSFEEGMEQLSKAIEIAKPDNVKLPFIENIIELEPLLKGLSVKNDDYIKQLILLGEKQKKSIKEFTLSKEHELLTKREIELMKLVEMGYKNVDISKELNIAQVTVEKTLTNIYRKLNVKNRTAALVKLKKDNII